MAHTILRGGRVLDIAAGTAEFADILIADDTIREIGPPGCAAPEGAIEISAARRLLHPGLVNAHTHGHGNLAKGMGDRWTLELLLTAAPWITGNRSLDDRYLSTLLGAVEMVMKGCTACYDLSFEWPLPTAEGLALAAQAYADVGMRAVIAPMVADRSFYEAIPGLIEAMPPALQPRVADLRLPPAEATLAGIRAAFATWPFDRRQICPAVAPTIPHHCSDEFILGCAALAREFDVGLHSHVAESKVQAVTGIRVYGRTQTAHLDALGVLGPRFTVAHGVWLDDDDMARLCGHVASFVSKVRGTDWRAWLTTREAALAATEGSARALGFEGRIGRLTPGYKADIVMLDLDHPNWLPLNDPVNQLVHSEDGGAVASVMIG